MNQEWGPSRGNFLYPDCLILFITNFYWQYFYPICFWRWMKAMSVLLSQTWGFVVVFFALRKINKVGQCD